ncbi:mucin TcMUCII, putative [Trypanosoma cruzi marinkellei]|uniref:Mucin TcMUCII, putative n=1 Tax=Trypanosoma cruzi marinkellei TaxID=85056 RepID=K2NGX9_TRYCR|nr:mucin TcMUCII, putative [Trypanosoma cruzi marinkellei]
MMTTCRLLCALLVLALCCCPSVCGTEVDVNKDKGNSSTPSQPGGTGVLGPGEPQSLSQEPGIQSGQSGEDGMQHNTEQVPGQPADTALTENPNAGTPGPITEQGPRDTDTQEAQSGDTAASGQTDTNVDDSAETTTANAPTTATTTTTAPEAPSTTTTEAPTTTTTRAPSRLPEIDGSLSSSAWVIAPLLLAVSALAYTTLG